MARSKTRTVLIVVADFLLAAAAAAVTVAILMGLTYLDATGRG